MVERLSLLRNKTSLIILAVFVLLIFGLNFFKIKNIVVSPQNCLAIEDIKAGHKLLFLLQTGKLEQELKQKFACIWQVKIAKNYPSTLKIDVTIKSASVKIADSDIAITEQGLAIKDDFAGDLPQLYLSSNTNILAGTTVTDEKILFAAQTVNLLTKTDFSPQTVRILENGDVAVYDKDATVAIFSLNKKKEEQVDSLQQVLAAAKIDGAKIAKIDLRFAKPVVTFK